EGHEFAEVRVPPPRVVHAAAPVVLLNGVNLAEDRPMHAVVDWRGVAPAEDDALSARPERVGTVEERCGEVEHPCERARVATRKAGPEPDQPEQRRNQHEGEEHVEDELTVRPSGIAARRVPVRGRQRTEQRVELPPRFLQFVANALPDLAVAHVEPSAAFKSARTTARPIRSISTSGSG